jgi:hypothetical protein
VVRESGPPHMKTFVTRCVVGEMSTEAEGNSKKTSKKRAAELMLEELKKLPSLPPALAKPKIKPPTNKKKNRNIIKVSSFKRKEIIMCFYSDSKTFFFSINYLTPSINLQLKSFVYRMRLGVRLG